MIGDGQGKRPRVYVEGQKGTFENLHKAANWALILFYLGAPWLTIGGHRMFFVDLPGRRLYLLGATFTAMDTRFMLVGLLAGGFAILLFTALVGRLWCGYFCPQTVWLEAWIRPVERLIEGRRGARKKLDERPWDADKVARKVSKWVVFVAMSAIMALGFISYFVESPAALWTGGGSATAYAATAAVGVAVFFDMAWFREQFCNYLCPYARLQAAIADEYTLTVGYHANVAEPRLVKGKDAKAQMAANPDICVDCGTCVQVCPQGIDIRDGYQLECITCGHCIDACTEVMDKRERPTLISYTTEAALTGKPKHKRLRPYIYGALMTLVLGIAGFLLAERAPIDARVTRAPGQLYVLLEDGSIQNRYNAHLLNNDREARHFVLSVENAEGLDVVLPIAELDIEPGDERTVPILVLASPEISVERAKPIEFVIRSGDFELRRPGIFQTGGATGEQASR
jgi:cytochrome c oxidase accessory protein FixG